MIHHPRGRLADDVGLAALALRLPLGLVRLAPDDVDGRLAHAVRPGRLRPRPQFQGLRPGRLVWAGLGTGQLVGEALAAAAAAPVGGFLRPVVAQDGGAVTPPRIVRPDHPGLQAFEERLQVRHGGRHDTHRRHELGADDRRPHGKGEVFRAVSLPPVDDLRDDTRDYPDRTSQRIRTDGVAALTRRAPRNRR